MITDAGPDLPQRHALLIGDNLHQFSPLEM